ncbi:hypothetical protein DPEC_G00334100 [Dallia pectoralis]|uniref:Uncharacterized protein n=1 Tax=Dallia pectoralis TaxID=75939 RepID=A0ACC2F6K9_DALPE|nr:hypothetical protein DPEC_G00334100 [Dallia pectoralis]
MQKEAYNVIRVEHSMTTNRLTTCEKWNERKHGSVPKDDCILEEAQCPTVPKEIRARLSDFACRMGYPSKESVCEQQKKNKQCRLIKCWNWFIANEYI